MAARRYETRVYVIVSAGGHIVGCKLNKTSALSLQRANRGSHVQPHMADKENVNWQGSEKNHATDERKSD